MDPTTVLIGTAKTLSGVLASKGIDYLIQSREENQIVDKAIKRIASKYKGAAPGGKRAVVEYLEGWTNSKAFKKFITDLEEGKSVEKTVQKAIKSFRVKTVSKLSENAEVVLSDLLKAIYDGLLDSSSGRSRQQNRIDAQFEDISAKNDEQLELLGNIKDQLESKDKEAVTQYLKYGEDWPPLKTLLTNGHFAEARNQIEDRLKKLNQLFKDFPSSKKVFHDHRVEMQLKLASLLTQLGEFGEAEKQYYQAKGLEINTPSLRRLALKVLLNLNKVNEYEVILRDGEIEEEEIAEIELHVLKSEWDKVLQAVSSNSKEYRLIYLSIVARLEVLDDKDLAEESPQILKDLERANSVKGNQPLYKVQLTNVAVHFVQRVYYRMIEAKDLNREKLISITRELVEIAIKECKELDYKRGELISLQSALKFYSVLEEEEEIKNVQKELNKYQSKDKLVSRPRSESDSLSKARELHQQAIYIINNSSGSKESDKAKSILETAFELANNEEKIPIAQSLISFYLNITENELAKNVLGRLNNVSEHNNCLLELAIAQNEKTLSEFIDYLRRAVERFPLSIQLRHFKIESLIETIQRNKEQGSGHLNDSLIKEVKSSVEFLNKILPTDSNKILFAKALIANNDLDKALKEADKVSTSTLVYITALRLSVRCLIELNRLNEVPAYLRELAEITKEPKYANEAAKYLMRIDEIQKANVLLEEWWKKHPEDPFISANLALTIIILENTSPEDGRRAFNLLSKAKRQYSGFNNIDLWMAKAARQAGKPEVYKRYLYKNWSNVPSVTIQKKEDFKNLYSSMEGGMIRVDLQGKDGIQAFIEWDKEFRSALNVFHKHDLMTYIDTFARNSQPWKQWVSWTITAKEQYHQNGNVNAIKSAWPFIRRKEHQSSGILLDLSALLTLSILSCTSEILEELKSQGTKIFLRSDELKKLRDIVYKPEESFLEIDQFPYDELLDELKNYDLISDYSSQQVNQYIELVPDKLHEDFGNHSVDYGLSISLNDALFIADKQDGLDNIQVVPQSISSRVLLKSLVEAGFIGENEANAAGRSNERFEKWEEVDSISLPQEVVFSAFSIRFWYEAGLLTTNQNNWLKQDSLWPTIHLGPFGITNLKREANEKRIKNKTKNIATTQLSKINELIDREIIYVVASNGTNESNINGHFAESNPNAIEVLELANERNLAIWADDRVFGYLLWPFNHPLPIPELTKEFNLLQNEYSETHLYTTETILEELYLSEGYENAEELGYNLVEFGYRPLKFRLAITYLLKNFRFTLESPKYKSFFQALEGLLTNPNNSDSNNSTTKINNKPQERLFLGSILPDILAHIMLADVNLTHDKRAEVADNLLGRMMKFIDSHREEMPDKMASFWVSLLHDLVNYPYLHGYKNNTEGKSDKHSQLELNNSLEWFVESLLKYEDEKRLKRAILAIEDLVIELVKGTDEFINSLDISDKKIEADKKDLITHRIQPLVVTLLNENLLEHFSPILRRALGVISIHDSEFKIAHTFSFDKDGKKIIEEVPEDDTELFAIGVLEDIVIHGNQQYSKFLTGDLRIDCSWEHPLPIEARKSDSQTYLVPINISLVRLLLRDEIYQLPNIFDAIINHLQLIDPILGQQLESLSANLTDSNSEIRSKAREEAALSIISSIYFEVQRSLPHALQKMQELKTSSLDEFLSPKTGWCNTLHSSIFVYEDREYPKDMLIDIYTLTLNRETLYETSFSSINDFIKSSKSKKDSFDNPKAIYSNKLENCVSPFKLGYRFLEFLIWAAKDNSKFDYKDETITSTEFIKEFLYRILGEKQTVEEKSDGSFISRENNLKVIHASVLRLATYVIGSSNHMSSWRNELEGDDKVMSSFTHGVLILSYRMLPFLQDKYQGNTNHLKDDLIESIESLSIVYEDPIELPDIFNPFLFGPHLFDHEVAAIIHSVITFIENNDNPEEILDYKWLKNLVQPWTTLQNEQAELIYENQKNEGLNTLGINMSFSPKETSTELLKILTNEGVDG